MKNALIYAFKESKWFSCTKIVANLLKCYDLILDKESLLRVDYNFENEFYDLTGSVDTVIQNRPDRIIFLDHRPNPSSFINLFFEKTPANYNPEIVFHIYGDFTIFLRQWLLMESKLKGKRVKFLCASEAQCELVQKCVDQKDAVFEMPFPVDFEEFNIVSSRKFNLRNSLKIQDEGINLIYTGRFSKNKNIIDLIEIFAEGLDDGSIQKTTHLILAGSFDNVGFIFGNEYYHEGETFRNFDRRFKKIEEKYKKNIHFIGGVPNNLLKEYYLDSDYFVSFSTYHDEDYGMSVAEAGACGCKMILTDWAGYKSFNINKSVHLISTSLSDKGPVFDKNLAKKRLGNLSFNNERDEVSNSFHIKSVDYNLDRLKRILKEKASPFSGFSGFMHKISRRDLMGKKVFFDEVDRKMNKEYKDLYESYVTKN